ncbi:high affinity immunoglobulin epsilon receptor subunit gamma-like [Arapaima gigas]
MSRGSVLVAVFLLNLGGADALEEAKICYILDGILFVYGIVLTVLYCRLKMKSSSGRVSGTTKRSNKQGHEDSIYTGLSHQTPDTYETLNLQNKGKA